MESTVKARHAGHIFHSLVYKQVMKEAGNDAEGVGPVWKALESNEDQNIAEAVWLGLLELSEFLPQTSSRAETNDSGLLGWRERKEMRAAACLQRASTHCCP